VTWSFAEVNTPNRVSFWTDGRPLPLRDPLETWIGRCASR